MDPKPFKGFPGECLTLAKPWHQKLHKPQLPGFGQRWLKRRNPHIPTEQLKRARSSSRLISDHGSMDQLCHSSGPNPSSLVLPNGPSREEISAGDKQAEPHPQSRDTFGSQVLYLQVGGHCFPYKTNKSSKKELGKSSRGRETGGGGEARKINTIKRNRGKKWGGKGGEDGPQPFGGMGMLTRGAAEG